VGLAITVVGDGHFVDGFFGAGREGVNLQRKLGVTVLVDD
jgi:hypothetical protein